MVMSGAPVLLGRVLQVATSALIGLLLPLVLSPDEMGLFFVWWAAVGVGTIVAQAGLTHTVAALIPKALAVGDTSLARGTIFAVIGLCATAALAVSAFALLFYWILRPIYGATDGATMVAVLAIVLVVPSALLGVLAEVCRAMHLMKSASFLPLAQGGGLIVACVIALSLSREITASQTLGATLATVSLSLGVGLARVAYATRSWIYRPSNRPTRHQLWTASWPNLATNLSIFSASMVDVWIVALFASPVQVAQYGVGTRLAALFTIPLVVTNATILPRIVEYWTKGDHVRLQSLLTLTATAATLVAGACFFFFILGGRQIIEIVWGDVYVPAFTIALILGIAQVVHTAGGSSGYLLLLLGNQKSAMKITGSIGILTIIAATLAMTIGNVIGVAIVYATANMVQTLAFVGFSRRFYSLAPGATSANPFWLFRTLSKPE